jgi:hypothetical protein
MFSAGVLRARTSEATPSSVKISIVRWLSTWAFGRIDVPA